MIQKQIRPDTTFIFGLEAILQAYQGQVMFSSFLKSYGLEPFNKFYSCSEKAKH